MNPTLQIIQPKALRDGFEIRHGDKLIGSLYCSGFFKPKAQAAAGKKQWRFVSAGLIHQKINVFDHSGITLLASFQANMFTSSGSVELDGKRYIFKKTSFWKQHYAWFNSGDAEVLSFKIGGLAKMAGSVTAANGFQSDKNCLLLVLLGLYNLKLDNDMNSAAAGSAVASTAAVASS